MFLEIDSIEAAKERSLTEAKKYSLEEPTRYWWSWITHEGKVYLSVDRGEGLTDEELALCVKELPEEDEG